MNEITLNQKERNAELRVGSIKMDDNIHKQCHEKTINTFLFSSVLFAKDPWTLTDTCGSSFLLVEISIAI